MFCLLNSDTLQKYLFVFPFFFFLELRFYGCCHSLVEKQLFLRRKECIIKLGALIPLRVICTMYGVKKVGKNSLLLHPFTAFSFLLPLPLHIIGFSDSDENMDPARQKRSPKFLLITAQAIDQRRRTRPGLMADGPARLAI